LRQNSSQSDYLPLEGFGQHYTVFPVHIEALRGSYCALMELLTPQMSAGNASPGRRARPAPPYA